MGTKKEIEGQVEANDKNIKSMAASAEQIERNTAAYKELDSILVDTSKELGLLTEQEAELGKELAIAEQKMSAANAAFLKAKKSGKGVEEAVKAVTGAFKELQSKKGVAGATVAMGNFTTSVGGSLQNIVQATLGIKTQGGALGDLGQSLMNAGKKGDFLKGVNTSLSKTFSKANVATGLMNVGLGLAEASFQKLVEAQVMAIKTSLELGQVLGRELGAVGNLAQLDGLQKLAQGSGDANVTFGSLGKAAIDLQRSTRGLFGNIATGNQQLALFSAEMIGLGVDTTTTAEIFGTFGMVLGVNGVNQIKKLEVSAVKLARTMGISSDAVLKDIAAMSDQLAIFGDESEDIALDIAKIGAASKISSQTVLKFTDAFATFPDAIEKANRINLLFGKTVISGDKMFKMMNDGAQGPAKAFTFAMESMGANIDDAFLKSPAKMKMFQEALAGTGVESAKLARDLAKANREGKSFSQVIEDQTKNFKKNQAALQSWSDFTTELKKLTDSLASSLGPVLQGLTSLLKSFNEWDSASKKTALGGAGVAGTALAGAAIGSIVPGIGTALGAGIGAGIGALGFGGGLSMMSAIGDGIITRDGNKTTVIPIDSKDDIIAAKPRGPLSSVSTMRAGSGGSPDAVEIIVNLFGKELVRQMVDLVSAEQTRRTTISNLVMGGNS